MNYPPAKKMGLIPIYNVVYINCNNGKTMDPNASKTTGIKGIGFFTIIKSLTFWIRLISRSVRPCINPSSAKTIPGLRSLTGISFFSPVHIVSRSGSFLYFHNQKSPQGMLITPIVRRNARSILKSATIHASAEITRTSPKPKPLRLINHKLLKVIRVKRKQRPAVA